jgi:hypothetical protein
VDGRQPNADGVVDATVRFEDEQASILNEIVLAVNQEEISIHDLWGRSSLRASDELLNRKTDLLTLAQLDLGAIKVEIHVQTLEELRDWIAVLVRLLITGGESNRGKAIRR